MAKGRTKVEEDDAVALIRAAAEEPSLDEVGRRARAALAAGAAVDEAGERAMVEHWRRARAAWGDARDKKESESET